LQLSGHWRWHNRRLRLVAALLLGLAGSAVTPAALAQDAAAAQLTLRIENLEAEVRDLTGQVQGLQFQLTQLQTMVQRQGQSEGSGDNGAGSGAAPATPRGSTTQDDGSGDSLGPSSDPLVGRGQSGEGRGNEEVPLGPSMRPAVAGPAPQRPPVASVAAAPPANPAAEATYKSGYASIVKGDYTTAAGIFKKFIKQYPDDPEAPDATNWLGEALLEQQDYVDAADVLVNGYKTYPDSPRAPDMLLKLGIALAGAQQNDAACKTFGLLVQKYTGTTAAFKSRLHEEMAKDKCSG
jgi:tol-pal system protein YbgF